MKGLKQIVVAGLAGLAVAGVLAIVGAPQSAQADMNVPQNAAARLTAAEVAILADSNRVTAANASIANVSNRVVAIEAKDTAGALNKTNTIVTFDGSTQTVTIVNGRIASWN